MPGEPDIQTLRAFADELADAARGVILPYFRAEHGLVNKAARGFDPVTEADKRAEETIRALIDQRFPEHGIIGEEFGAKPSRSGYMWILDPIDGTRAFIAGLPLWGVLIGLVQEGKPILGIIDQPYLGERFSGWLGDARGAQLQTRDGVRPLKARACPQLTDAVIATTDPKIFSGGEAAAFEQVRAAAKLARYGCDCYAYAMAAMGSVDLVMESGLAPWDVAALIPVLEGAGGGLTDWRGRALQPEFFSAHDKRTQAIAFGDARARDEALIALKRAAH
ncbi:MAG: histidinol-phosphatase [Hyphomonadaceae bacterium]